jgi:hypothetical protein
MTRPHASVLVLLCFTVTVVLAADPEAPPAAPAKKPAVAAKAKSEQRPPEKPAVLGEKFPAPLEAISCNILELEKTGYFRIQKVEVGRTEDFGDEAFIWTIAVTRSLTCRMAMMLLDRFVDVRFFDADHGMPLELYATRLNYSARISDEAIDGGTLDENDVFQLWLHLDDEAVRMLRSRSVDKAVFGRTRK